MAKLDNEAEEIFEMLGYPQVPDGLLKKYWLYKGIKNKLGKAPMKEIDFVFVTAMYEMEKKPKEKQELPTERK